MSSTEAVAALAAVKTIRPVLEEHRRWADEHARMAPEVREAARSAGVFTLMAPREVGGGEASLPEILAVFEELGTVDPTVAWHAGNSAAIAFASPYLPAEDRDRVFADGPGPFGFSIVAGGVAVAVDGGYRLSGRWPFLTGAADVTWAAVGGVVHEDGEVRQIASGPDVRLFIVPAAALTAEPTWATASAMRGTGSNAVSVTDAFVPEGLAHSWLKPKLFDRPLYRLPSLTAGPVCNAAIVIGLTRRAVEDATALVAAKVSRADSIAYRDRPRIQRLVAEAHAMVALLHVGLADMASEVWAFAEGGRIPVQARGRMWSTAFLTLDRSRRLLSDLLPISTSAVYSDRNPIESALRDAHAICASMETYRDAQEAAGRVLLGLRPALAGF